MASRGAGEPRPEGASHASVVATDVTRLPRDGASTSAARDASTFARRVADLDVKGIGAAVGVWRAVMQTDSDAWFAAERAAGDAVLRSGRTTEQAMLLETLADSVLRQWYRGARGQPPLTPERYVGATEPSGQYTATVAMIAILVRDHLRPDEFEVLYRPFATLIPVEQFADRGDQ